MTKKRESSAELPNQSEEARAVALANAPTGSSTATGQAILQAAGAEQERIDNLESRGSTTPARDEGIKPDFAQHEPSEPAGLQAQPAAFTVNGSVNPTFVASPGGPVPVSAVATSAEHAAKLLEEHHKNAERSLRRRGAIEPLDENMLNRMNVMEVRAVAHDRGYDLPDNRGRRTTVEAFLKAQSEDTRFQTEESGEGEQTA